MYEAFYRPYSCDSCEQICLQVGCKQRYLTELQFLPMSDAYLNCCFFPRFPLSPQSRATMPLHFRASRTSRSHFVLVLSMYAKVRCQIPHGYPDSPVWYRCCISNQADSRAGHIRGEGCNQLSGTNFLLAKHPSLWCTWRLFSTIQDA